MVYAIKKFCRYGDIFMNLEESLNTPGDRGNTALNYRIDLKFSRNTVGLESARWTLYDELDDESKKEITNDLSL